MAAFSHEEDLSGRLDWILFRDGPLHQYRDETLLNSDLARLRAEGYEVVDFDCAEWPDELAMHREFKEALRFPDDYGMNLDAFNDCIRDFRPEGSGAVVVLRRLETLSARNFREGASKALSEILCDASRWHLLFGTRFLTLILSSAESMPTLPTHIPQWPRRLHPSNWSDAG